MWWTVKVISPSSPYMDTPIGLEPIFSAPKADVLPLDDKVLKVATNTMPILWSPN